MKKIIFQLKVLKYPGTSSINSHMYTDKDNFIAI